MPLLSSAKIDTFWLGWAGHLKLCGTACVVLLPNVVVRDYNMLGRGMSLRWSTDHMRAYLVHTNKQGTHTWRAYYDPCFDKSSRNDQKYSGPKKEEIKKKSEP